MTSHNVRMYRQARWDNAAFVAVFAFTAGGIARETSSGLVGDVGHILAFLGMIFVVLYFVREWFEQKASASRG